MTLDFGDVLGRTWKIGWNHKVLWLFQMLPMLLSVLVLPFMFLANPAFASFLPEPFDQLSGESGGPLLFFILAVTLIIPMTFISCLTQAATTLGALKAEKAARRLFFREIMKESLPYFWRVLGLYALFGIVWMVMATLFMALNLGVSVITLGLGSLCLMPLFLLLLPIAIAGYAILEFAQVAIIADNMKTMDAISKGWQIFRANMLPVVVLMLILYFGLTIISSIFMFPMMIPMMLFPLAIDQSGQFNTSFLWVLLGLFPIMMILMSIVQGILMAFFQSAWVVTYTRLTGGKNIPVFVEAA